MRRSGYLRSLAVFLLTVSLAPSQSATAPANQVEQHEQAARKALAQHDLSRAFAEYDAILKLDSRNATILSARGVVLYALGKPAQALVSLRAALAIEPGSSEAETFLGLSLADSGDCSTAEPVLQRRFTEALEPKSRRLVGLALLGCAGVHDTQIALDTAQRLARWFPDDADVLYQLAELYSELSRRAVNELLKKHPDSFRVHELAGEAWEAQGNDEQALSEFHRALEFSPRAPHLHYRIAEILLRKKTELSDNAALEEFKQELAVNPSDAASEYQLAELLRRKGDLVGASAHFCRAFQIDPAMPAAHIGLAKVKTAQKDSNAAIEQLEIAVRLAPAEARSHYALMQAYKEAGRSDDAKHELVKVQEITAKEQHESNNLLRTLLTGPEDHK